MKDFLHDKFDPLCMLLVIAYITVAERKTMASMQRRLGPNNVGQLKFNLSFKRSYHHNSNKIISELYLNRKAPIKPFEEKIVSVCKDLLSSTALNTFFKNCKGKGGIYLFTYKSDPNIYYIGRAKDFQKRFKAHLNINLKDRFHIFANTVGWDKFEFSIIEICSLDMHQEKENYYLQKYLPLLNTIFKSNLSDTQTYDSLYEILKLRQLESNFDNKYRGISIYLYEYVNGQLSTNYSSFKSINQLSRVLGISRETISIYLNTFVPFKGNLFLTDIIEYPEIIEKLVSDATQGLELYRTIAKKVWMYFIKADGTIVKTIYDSIGGVAKVLNVHHTVINNHLDKWIKGGLEGNYLFSSELDSLELEKLMEISLLRKHNNLKVWVYDALTLQLISDVFSSIKKAADYFNVDYRSLLNHLDTKLATVKGGKLVLLFSNELTELEKESLLNKVKKATNETTPVWVYKNVKGVLILINSNKPTYNSKLLASKNLNISTKTISKYLDSDKSYKGLYFYSTFKE